MNRRQHRASKIIMDQQGVTRVIKTILRRGVAPADVPRFLRGAVRHSRNPKAYDKAFRPWFVSVVADRIRKKLKEGIPVNWYRSINETGRFKASAVNLSNPT